MPLKQSEAIVLRSYPVHEADLLVTFFTRAEGKVRGVAKSAKRSKKRFGGALEPLTQVTVYWEEKARNELTRVDHCDVLASPLTDAVDYARAVALGYVAEVLDEFLPDREANDAIFRLANAVLDALRPGAIWLPLTYLDLWLVRLAGLLPEFDQCVECGKPLHSRAFFHPLADGLMCEEHKRLASTEMSAHSRNLVHEMLRNGLPALVGRDGAWPRQTAADLRKFLRQRIEQHLEKRLNTAGILDRLE